MRDDVFAEELQRLTETQATLDHQIERKLRYSQSAEGATHDASFALRQIFHEDVHHLRRQRDSPYFARIDVRDVEEKYTTHYIGKYSLVSDNTPVISWNAPIAKLYYIGRPDGPLVYSAPSGEIETWVGLKRNLTVRRGKLEDVSDEFDVRQELKAGLTAQQIDANRPSSPSSERLRARLEESSDLRLRDIVETIQTEQYDLIQAPADQTLVVQGVAGSGKTSIALHRLAYLLYPGNADGIRSERCLVLGPSRLFLRYISDVLPELQVTGIAQHALVDWALRDLGLEGVKVVDATAGMLFDNQVPRKERAIAYLASRWKTSLRMGELLREYHRQLLSEPIPIPQSGLIVSEIGPHSLTPHVTATKLREITDRLTARSLVRRWDQFVQAIVVEVRSQAEGLLQDAARSRAFALREQGEVRRTQVERLAHEITRQEQFLASFRDGDKDAAGESVDVEKLALIAATNKQLNRLRTLRERQESDSRALFSQAEREQEQIKSQDALDATLTMVRARVAAAIEKLWPRPNARNLYDKLIQDRKLLAHTGNGIFDSVELDLLHRRLPLRGKESIEHADLPAIHYLHSLISPRERPIYDHVIVDEAQDVAPLHFEVLRTLTKQESLTILGDLAQGDFSHRGLTNWSEISPVFRQVADFSITKCYRATWEIAQFTNAVLRSLTERNAAIVPAVPFARHGAKPVLCGYQQEAELPGVLNRLVGRFRGDGLRRIAIILKSQKQCRDLERLLQSVAAFDFAAGPRAVIDSSDAVSVLPVSIAKGLEFDACIAMCADSATYNESELDGRLLYVALTRGMHQLAVLWSGELSSHIRKYADAETYSIWDSHDG